MKNDFRMPLIFSLVIALIFNLFLFHRISFVTGCIFLGLFAAGFISEGIRRKNINISQVYGELSLLLLFSALLIIRANPFVRTGLLFIDYIILAILGFKSFGYGKSNYGMNDFIILPLTYLGGYLTSVFSYLDFYLIGNKNTQNNLKNNEIKQIFVTFIVGITIAAPVIFILTFLFSIADPVFSTYIKKIFSNIEFSKLLERFFISIFVFIVTLPVLAMALSNGIKSRVRNAFFTIGKSPVTIAVIAVAGFLGIYLFVAWQYLFITVSRETDLSKFGIKTFSEYVNRGFYEFLLSSFIVYLFSWVGIGALNGPKSRNDKTLKIAVLTLLLIFSVFLLSLFRRIGLYWSFHGLTLARGYGGIFLILISAMTITLIGRVMKPRNWIKYDLSILLLYFFTIGILPLENFIAKYHPPSVNNNIDYVYLSRFSSDGFEAKKTSLTWAKNNIDKYITSQNLLDENMRNEIAYSGMIISKIISDYLNLNLIYGSKNNRDTADFMLLTSLYNRVNQYLPLLMESSEILNDTGSYEEAPIYSVFVQTTDGTDPKNQIKDEIETVKLMQKNIGDAILSEQNIETYLTGKRFFARGSGTYNSWFPGGSCEYLAWYQDFMPINRFCIPGFLAIVKSSPNETGHFSAADSISQFSFSDLNSFRKMQKVNSLAVLLDYESKYIKLLYRIYRQPISERNVTFDRNFNAPLN